MKKIKLLTILLIIALLFTACKTKSVSDTTSVSEPEPTPPITEDEPEPDPNPQSAEPLSTQPDITIPTPQLEEPDPPTLDALRNLSASYGCRAAVAYLGVAESKTKDAITQCIVASGQWDQYTFLCAIPDYRMILLGGSEVYCIVPASTDASITVQKLTYLEDGTQNIGETLYEGDAHPILIAANESDIMPNALITIDDGESFSFSPFMSPENDTLTSTAPDGSIFPFGLKAPPFEPVDSSAAENGNSSEETPSNGNVIYLTFDDGPGKYTQELLDILDRYNVKVTFFVTNAGDSDLIGEEFRRGHSVGIHSATHDYDNIYSSEDAYFADLEKMSDIIYEQTGERTKLLRFPGGSSNRVSSFNPGIMTRLTEAVKEHGYQYFDWNVLSGDAGETTDTDEIVQNVIDGCTDRSASIVLQHDIKGYSVAAVERIIQWGLENGYTFERLAVDSPSAHHRINN